MARRVLTNVLRGLKLIEIVIECNCINPSTNTTGNEVPAIFYIIDF